MVVKVVVVAAATAIDHERLYISSMELSDHGYHVLHRFSCHVHQDAHTRVVWVADGWVF